MTALLLITVISVWLLRLHTKQLRKKMIYKFLEKNLIAQAPAQRWFSTPSLMLIAKALNKLPKKLLQPIFVAIKKQNFIPLLQFYKSDDLKLMCGKKISPSDKLTRAEIALLNLDFSTCSKILENLKANNTTDKARILVLEAGLALHEGDLESANIKINSAISKFKKLKMAFEEAAAYQLCGIIYKACALNDPAEIMLQTSIEIFEDVGAFARQAETLGILGMLMVQQSRLQEATDFFQRSLHLFEAVNDKNGIVNIYNQMSVTALINNNLSEAKKYTKEATLNLNPKYLQGRALSTDIKAQIENSNNNWKQAIKLASEAEILYKKGNNFSATLEMMQLQAQALIKIEKITEAEKTLRNIIKMAKKKQTCFHIANAYNLLGVIYLKQNNLNRAKSLFNQSISLELCNERWCGAAIDYANIALTEYRAGKNQDAIKNREIALEYAKESGDEELLELIQKKLNHF